MNTFFKTFEQHRVLFVDDELLMLKSMARALNEESFGREYCSSAQEALIALHAHRFTVVVTDLKMPDISGLEFLNIVKKQYPKMIRIIATGVTDLSDVLTAIHSGETHRYISKPVNISEELLPTLHQAFELYDLQRTQERLSQELLETNTFLQHQKEEIVFFKNLSEQSNIRKEKLLNRLNTLFIPLLDALQAGLADIGANSPLSLQHLANYYQSEHQEFVALRKELAESQMSLEFHPAEPQ